MQGEGDRAHDAPSEAGQIIESPLADRLTEVVLALDEAARDLHRLLGRCKSAAVLRAADAARLRSQALLLAIRLNVEYSDVVRDARMLADAVGRLELLMVKARTNQGARAFAGVVRRRSAQLVTLLDSWVIQETPGTA